MTQPASVSVEPEDRDKAAAITERFGDITLARTMRADRCDKNVRVQAFARIRKGKESGNVR